MGAKFSKIRFFCLAAFSLVAVGFTAVSTAAWFAASTVTYDGGQTVSAGSSEVQIDEIKGYKAVRQTDENGYLEPNGTTHETKIYSASESSTENNGSDESNTTLDVPSKGVGYYIIPANNSGQFLYATPGTTKMTEVEGSSQAYADISLSSGTTTFRFKKYTFAQDQSGMTVTDNSQVSVPENGATNCTRNSSGDIEITVASNQTRRVWLDVNNGKAGLEEAPLNLGTLNASAEKTFSDSGLSPKKAGSTSITGETTIYLTKLSWMSAYINYRVGNDEWSGYKEMTQDDGQRYYYDVPANTTIIEFNHTDSYQGANCTTGHLSPYENGNGLCNHYTISDQWGNYDSGGLSGSWSYWTGHNYTVSYNNNGGSGTISDQTCYLNNATLSSGSSFTKTGHTLVSWNTKSNGTGQNYTLSGSYTYSNTLSYKKGVTITLYAKWAAKTCALTFDKDGGNGGTDSATAIYGQSMPSIALPTKSGFTFGGYYTSRNGGGTQYYNESGVAQVTTNSFVNSSSSKTLYAYWTENTVAVYLVTSGHGGVLAPSWSNNWNCYGWVGGTNATYSRNSYENVNLNGETYTKHKFYVRSTFTSLIFYGSAMSGGNTQTVNISFDSSTNADQYYVLTNQEQNNGKYYGDWYSSINAISNDTRTYKVFDKDGVLSRNSGTPTVYAWIENESGSAFYVNHENSAYPGVALTSLAATEGEGFYSFTCSETYDSFILNNGKASQTASGAFQTSDLTGSDGLTSGHANWYYILKGNTATEVSSGVYECEGEWASSITSIQLKIAFFIQDGVTLRKFDTSLMPEQVLDNDFTYTGENYSPSITATSQVNGGNPYEYCDEANGILYHFAVSSISWYQGGTVNSSAFTPGSVYAGSSLYLRAICNVGNLKTFYVDTKNWNSNVYVRNAAGDKRHFGTSGLSVNANLFRITLPDDYHFTLSTSSDASGNWLNPTVNLASEDSTNYFFVNGSGNNAPHLWLSDSLRASYDSVATATMSIGGNTYSMGVGDVYTRTSSGGTTYIRAHYNHFIYEQGVYITANQTLSITVSISNGYVLEKKESTDAALTSTTYSTRAALTDGDKSKSFLDGAGGNDDSKPLKFVTAGRYTFYVTADGQISIASVPQLGNGFYIMHYTSTTVGFAGAEKMFTIDDTSASFDGWISTTGVSDYIYIRSYMNAVDRLLTQIVVGAGMSDVTIDNGVIHLPAGAKYNLRVSGDKVYISGYATDEFFKMDPLISGISVENNFTSIVLQVKFHITCTLPVCAQLESGSLPSYLGAQFYVHTNGAAVGNPYTYMRTNKLSTLNRDGQWTSNVSLTTNAADTYYYAYIIVDYYQPTTIATNENNAIQFYLKTVQA